MDFMNRNFRNGQPTNQGTSQSSGVGTPTPPNNDNKKSKLGGGFSPKDLGQAGKLAFLILITALIALAFLALFTFKGRVSEVELVDRSNYQAVFLNGGQVYFGKVDKLNNKYLELSNIYYLRVNQQVQPDANAAAQNNDISLVKLGCELHGPQDQMVINREQIVFWENLKQDGQVAQAIGQYIEQFPEGQDCEEQAGNTAPPQTGNNESQQQTTPTGENNQQNQTDTPTQNNGATDINGIPPATGNTEN